METKVEEVIKFARMSVFTAQMIDRLSKMQVGDVATDKELTKIIGRDTSPGGAGYGNLKSAINYLLTNNRVVIERVREASAVKRLEDVEIVNMVGSDLKSINKKAKKVLKKADVVDRNSLDQENKQRLITSIAQAGFLQLLTKSTTVKQLNQKALNEYYKPDISKIKWD